MDKDSDRDEGPQQEVNDATAVVTVERIGGTHLSGNEDRSPRSPSDNNRFPTAIYLQSQVRTRREATVTSATSLTIPNRTRRVVRSSRVENRAKKLAHLV